MSGRSDWDDWLLRAVEERSVSGIDCWYLGCNGLIVKGGDGTTIFIDPYTGLGMPPRTVRMIPVPYNPEEVTIADAILTTHEHSDHVDGPSQAPILAASRATWYGSDASIERVRDEAWADSWAVEPDQFVEVMPGDTLAVGDLTVHVEPAHDPMADGAVSYVITDGDRTLFHGGDTRYDENLMYDIGHRFDIDLGVVAFGTTGRIADKQTGELRDRDWYADGNEVIDIARALDLGQLVPTHWDMWRGLTANPRSLYRHAESRWFPDRLTIAEVGDRLDV